MAKVASNSNRQDGAAAIACYVGKNERWAYLAQRQAVKAARTFLSKEAA